MADTLQTIPERAGIAARLQAGQSVRVINTHGQQVVDNDGVHAVVSKTGAVRLEPGMHKIVVTFFESAVGEALSVKYKGPSIPLQELTCWCEQ